MAHRWYHLCVLLLWMLAAMGSSKTTADDAVTTAATGAVGAITTSSPVVTQWSGTSTRVSLDTPLTPTSTDTNTHMTGTTSVSPSETDESTTAANNVFTNSTSPTELSSPVQGGKDSYTTVPSIGSTDNQTTVSAGTGSSGGTSTPSGGHEGNHLTTVIPRGNNSEVQNRTTRDVESHKEYRSSTTAPVGVRGENITTTMQTVGTHSSVENSTLPQNIFNVTTHIPPTASSAQPLSSNQTLSNQTTVAMTTSSSLPNSTLPSPSSYENVTSPSLNFTRPFRTTPVANISTNQNSSTTQSPSNSTRYNTTASPATLTTVNSTEINVTLTTVAMTTRTTTTATPGCGDPGKPSNGYYLHFGLPHFVVGSYVVYRCKDNFRLDGNPERHCGADLRWTGHLPHCVVVPPTTAPPTTLPTRPPSHFNWRKVFIAHRSWSGYYTYNNRQVPFQMKVHVIYNDTGDVQVFFTDGTAHMDLIGNSRWDGKSDLILFDILTLFKKSNHFPDKSNWVAEGRLYSDARARWLYQAKIDSNRPFGIMKMAPDIVSPTEKTKTGPKKDKSNLGIILGITIPVLFLIILGIVLVLCLRKRGVWKSRRQNTLTSFENPVYELECNNVLSSSC